MWTSGDDEQFQRILEGWGTEGDREEKGREVGVPPADPHVDVAPAASERVVFASRRERGCSRALLRSEGGQELLDDALEGGREGVRRGNARGR